MPKILPFKGVRYNKDVIKDMTAVVAPPYDIIPVRMQGELYAKDPVNVVRLILGKINKTDGPDNNRYTRAKDFFLSWLKDNILIQDKKESFYIYSQKYKKGNKYIDQIGFIGLMGVEESGDNKVMPHENTLMAPKVDRLSLIREVRANLSPIFVLYDDAKHAIVKILKKVSSKNKPLIDIELQGVRHRMWALDDERLVKKVESLAVKKPLFIADGHHRYEVAKMYSKELDKTDVPQALKDAVKYLMVYFVESDEKMLTVLPAHRLVKDPGPLTKEDVLSRLEKYFRIYKAAGIKNLMTKLAALSKTHAFGLYFGNNNFYILKLKSTAASDKSISDKPKEWRRLDVSILHHFIFRHILNIRDEDDNIEFLKDPEETVRFIDEGKCKIAFFLNPTKVSQVQKIAKLGEKMPRKATYFYPKQLSGLVINKH